jgi:hypothetical protein
VSPATQRHQILSTIHERLQPGNYLEVGTRDGASLALSRARSIAIDPAFAVKHEIHCDVALYRQTSDEFFARPNPMEHFGDGRIDLAFIDGLHLFEFALRDFMNIEQHAAPTSVIVFDDVLPRDVPEAARDRVTKFWAGDVYKMLDVLHRLRPDLICLPLDSAPTGLLLVLGADPNSRVLPEAYHRIVADLVQPDPQDVPAEILRRTGTVSPQGLLDSPVLPLLAELRETRADRATVLQQLAPLVADLPRATPARRVPHLSGARSTVRRLLRG